MLLEKIKIQIPTAERLFGFSTIAIVCGSCCTYFLDMEIFVGTLCTSLILLINIKFWIIIVKRLISIVSQTALEVEAAQGKNQQLEQEENSDSESSDASTWAGNFGKSL